MRLLILHDHVGDAARPDEVDVLDQAEAVAAALADLAHSSRRRPVDLDLARLAGELSRRRPDCVFNLVEQLAGAGRLVHVVPSLLDHLAVPYSGAPAEAQVLTGNKLLAKQVMAREGIATPEWRTAADLASARTLGEGDWIVKSVWEHASLGLDEGSVLRHPSAAAAAVALAERLPRLGGAGFVERYVEGREINLSLLASAEGTPEVLPPAEIVFEGWQPGRPRVVGYRAKWDEASFEATHTVRRFGLAAADEALLGTLERLARRLWAVFGLRGYARVDFRVDAAGEPWVLEVNTNPCLAPGAGFAAALERAGHPFREAVARILADALQPAAALPSSYVPHPRDP
ncbi:MAG TPA: D-alanine--D-alanine ligase [Thermoanaerobaculia bacterium]|nr:D-alanine--D-alanine ligase [Thermoanaerobaculia bacterium]